MSLAQPLDRQQLFALSRCWKLPTHYYSLTKGFPITVFPPGSLGIVAGTFRRLMHLKDKGCNPILQTGLCMSPEPAWECRKHALRRVPLQSRLGMRMLASLPVPGPSARKGQPSLPGAGGWRGWREVEQGGGGGRRMLRPLPALWPDSNPCPWLGKPYTGCSKLCLQFDWHCSK